MAERLTRNSKFSFYNQNDLDAMYDKLAELEDIMDDFHISCIDELHERLCWVEEQNKELDKIYAILEKYGTNVNELDNALFQRIVSIDNPFVKGYVQAKIDAINRAEQDRDTWKRACEFLAYKYAEEYFDGRDIEHCFNANKRDKFVKENINYFYQQAKTEGSDE